MLMYYIVLSLRSKIVCNSHKYTVGLKSLSTLHALFGERMTGYIATDTRVPAERSWDSNTQNSHLT